MPIDYESIRQENLRKYGTDIGRIGDMLLSNRYDNRTHFIYEILQNAEDALRKRGEWGGSRAVAFSLSDEALSISHFGKPFDDDDVRGVCGIGESTKELTDIGRFGIGFKSVYAFTNRPEIHSGQNHFAIDSYVWPMAVNKSELLPDETVIRIPFQEDETEAQEDIVRGLRRFGPRTLLFLREIEEISWDVNNGSSGFYSRRPHEDMGRNARIVKLIGQDDSWGDVKEEWLVFSREAFKNSTRVGYVEIAFALSRNKEDEQKLSIMRVEDSPLTVFFPTVISTDLGFRVQGPYRTTPSRDNVPEEDDWNQYLVEETAKLLVEALRQLREVNLLDMAAVECLPLSRPSFSFQNGTHYYSEWRFKPLFEAIREVLMTETLLPAYRGGHIAGQNAKLARSQDLRDLIDTEQLATLYTSDKRLSWLREDITQDRSPRVHEYLISELDIDEVTPESFTRLLSKNFLEAQPDEWMERLYKFLSGRRGTLLERLKRAPIVRLEDDSHTVAFAAGKPNAYLPGDTPTAFPTVKRSVCKSEEALAFLKGLGLRVPDPVDDVIENLLPKYALEDVEVSACEYQDDIERILNAYETDSTSRKKRLVSALKNVRFLIAVDAGNGESQFVHSVDAYMATDRLSVLFEGVPGVLLIDKSKECLTGEPIRDLLRAVGAHEYLQAVEINGSLTSEEKRQLREDYWEAHPWLSRGNTREISENDYELRGLDMLLEVLATLGPEQAPIVQRPYGRHCVMFTTVGEAPLSWANTHGCTIVSTQCHFQQSSLKR